MMPVMVMSVVTVMVMAMMMVVMIAMMMPVVMLVAMHGTIGVSMLVGSARCSTLDRGFARRASANRAHQSTSSSLILSSSPEVICN